MPSNSRSMNELHELPIQFKQTIAGEQFLLYDSFEDIDYHPTWFVDGTFKVIPTIFFQLFTILGPTTQTTNGTDQVIGLPLVYALLESKEEAAYSKAEGLQSQYNDPENRIIKITAQTEQVPDEYMPIAEYFE
ncbi:MULE domain-containing protein, partial [Aphis craccivora]